MVTFQEEKIYQAFYTKSMPIVDYMVEKLNLSENDTIFEPCGGDGVFIDAMLSTIANLSIEVNELNQNAYENLCIKYSTYNNVQIKHADTLLDNDLGFKADFGGHYNKIIANPPYGGWQDYDKRLVLKKIYKGLYVKETYSLFLYRCIELLKEGGILSFIVPDTFLNLHVHKSLREHILTRTKILELVLIPSSFFPGVNFGYANLSIVTLQKCHKREKCLINSFNVFNSFSRVEQLYNLQDDNVKKYEFYQNNVYQNPDHALFIADDSKIITAINKSELKVGDVANCVTGFYSGDDKTFLQVIDSSLKNGKNYKQVAKEAICENYEANSDILNGIKEAGRFIPIVKGGNVKYLKPDSWFMDWGVDAVKHYKTDKKARFQNSQYYFKIGIGVPMISSSSITASLIENKIFDQSIVGIFPKDENIIFYLLAFFNSPTCNKLIRTINPSANNPANYLKKIPFFYPNSEQKSIIDDCVMKILKSVKSNGNYDSSYEVELNDVISSIYGF